MLKEISTCRTRHVELDLRFMLKLTYDFIRFDCNIIEIKIS